MKEHKNTGLFLVFTGNGKGKTTSALGLALRALGHGHKVAMIQFLKGGWQGGEIEAAKRFADLFDVHVMGLGFTWKSSALEKDIQAAHKAWRLARLTITANKHQLVILDELTYLLNYGLLEVQDVVDIIVARPAGMNLVVTGRDAPDSLIEAADLVTEMREIKHPYAAGIMAQKGIEF